MHNQGNLHSETSPIILFTKLFPTNGEVAKKPWVDRKCNFTAFLAFLHVVSVPKLKSWAKSGSRICFGIGTFSEAAL